MTFIYRVGNYLSSSMQGIVNQGFRLVPVPITGAALGSLRVLAAGAASFYNGGRYYAHQIVQRCRRNAGPGAPLNHDEEEIDRVERVVEPVAHPDHVREDREPQREEVFRERTGLEEVQQQREEYVGELRRRNEPELAYILNRVYKRILKDPACRENGRNFLWVRDMMNHHVKRLNRKPSVFLRRFWAWMARPIRKCIVNGPVRAA